MTWSLESLFVFVVYVCGPVFLVFLPLICLALLYRRHSKKSLQQVREGYSPERLARFAEKKD